jgi:hypothetical protein
MPTSPEPIATLDQLEERVGTIANPLHAQSLLRYASSLVRAEGNRNWDDEDTPPELAEVVVGMVERAQANPEGLTQSTTGPFSVSFGSNAAQRVYLTVGDKKIIRAAAGGGAFSVDSAVPVETEPPYLWWPLVGP